MLNEPYCSPFIMNYMVLFVFLNHIVYILFFDEPYGLLKKIENVEIQLMNHMVQVLNHMVEKYLSARSLFSRECKSDSSKIPRTVRTHWEMRS